MTSVGVCLSEVIWGQNWLTLRLAVKTNSNEKYKLYSTSYLSVSLMLNTSLIPHEVRLCCIDCGHQEEQILCGWKICSLTSDLLLSSQIATELIQSSAVATALHSLVSLVQLLPQVYWDQDCFWFTSSATRWTSTLKNHSVASYYCSYY